ncbi:MAG: ATP-binding protein [Chloroflexi bacterium]|nr:ATP-binding protein [Chloroflexota bacterium]
MTSEFAFTVTAEPTLVMMAGLPGSGKTALATRIGRALTWPVIDKDTMKTTLLESGIPESVAAGLAYELTYAVAQDLLAGQKRSLLIDTPFTHPRTLTKANQLVRLANGRLKVILCQCPDDLRNQRMQRRPQRASQPRSIQDPGGNPDVRYDYLPTHTLILDTSQPMESLVTKAVDYVTSRASHVEQAGMTAEQKAELERVVAGIRQAFEELLVPELRAVSETVRRSNERMAQWRTGTVTHT